MSGDAADRPGQACGDRQRRRSSARHLDQFRDAANYVVRHARDDDGYVTTSTRRLHDRTFEEVRAATDLHANLVQAARSRAAEALKSVVATWKRGKYASLPHFTSPFLEYDQRSATFHDDHASLSTVKGRITAEYFLPDEDRETPHSQYLFPTTTRRRARRCTTARPRTSSTSTSEQRLTWTPPNHPRTERFSGLT